jgi:hypothetical protein
MKYAVVLALMFSRVAMSDMATRLYIDGFDTSSEPYTLEAGKPSDWVFEIFDPTSPEPFHHFHPMHGKEVHAFVIADDLSSFTHFHPSGAGSSHLGLFQIGVNQPVSDPDSQDASRAVPYAGRYFVYNESMPMTELMTVLGLDVVATGTPRPVSPPVTATPVDASGAMNIQHEDYRLKITHEAHPHPGTIIITIGFRLEHFDPAAGSFVPVTDLEPWLESYAHAVLVSVAGETATKKSIVHLHAVWPIVGDPDSGRGPDFELAADTHIVPRMGLYKTWLQFKHAGRVHSVPFAFEVKEPTF